jgi:hypothetical protein
MGSCLSSYPQYHDFCLLLKKEFAARVESSLPFCFYSVISSKCLAVAAAALLS